MPYYLSNHTFQLIVHPEISTWDLVSERENPVLQNVHMSVHYRTARTHEWMLEQWDRCHIGAPEIIHTPAGPAHSLIIGVGPDRHQIECQVIFALPESEPSIRWKVQVKNRSRVPIHLEQIEMLNLGFINLSHGVGNNSFRRSLVAREGTSKSRILLSPNRAGCRQPGLQDLGFFSNGWQSWSYSGVYSPGDRYQSTRLGMLRQPMITNSSTPRSRRAGLIASDMFGILADRQYRRGILAGFLSQKNHYGSLQAYLDPLSPTLRMWASGDSAQLDPGESMATDWASIFHLQLDAPDPLGPYLDAVSREHALHSLITEPPTGWCSWYYFSDRDLTGTVTPQAIRENTLSAARYNPELPIELIQIDDGFERAVGDWLEVKPDFSGGMSQLAAEIRQAGMKPGLWLAPFIVHPGSSLYQDHPEWLLRTPAHRPVNAGLCWNALNTALDLTHPDAMNYCQEVVHHAVHTWGYPYLKLDFLYAASLRGKYHDPHKTRAQVLREGLEALRSAAGQEATLLGCGCPLGPAIGLVDVMRVGTDTIRTWYPSFKGTQVLIKQDHSMPSAAYSIHNALTRSPLHRRWWINDPDCLLVRPDSQLTIDEIHTIASVIALTGGSLMLSDDLPRLPEDRLNIAKSLLPLIGERPYLLDWFDQATPSLLQLDLSGACGKWSLIAVFNWEDKPADRLLQLNQTYLNPDENYLAREFWSGQQFYIQQGGLHLHKIPAHGVRLLAIRPHRSQMPTYAGSDLHISQGLEVSQWKTSRAGVDFCIERPGNAVGVVSLCLPKAPISVSGAEFPLTWHALDDHLYQLPVRFHQSIALQVSW